MAAPTTPSRAAILRRWCVTPVARITEGRPLDSIGYGDHPAIATRGLPGRRFREGELGREQHGFVARHGVLTRRHSCLEKSRG